jgi:hypothetical protein
MSDALLDPTAEHGATPLSPFRSNFFSKKSSISGNAFIYLLLMNIESLLYPHNPSAEHF